jgi:hypothetical protein
VTISLLPIHSFSWDIPLSGGDNLISPHSFTPFIERLLSPAVTISLLLIHLFACKSSLSSSEKYQSSSFIYLFESLPSPSETNLTSPQRQQNFIYFFTWAIYEQKFFVVNGGTKLKYRMYSRAGSGSKQKIVRIQNTGNALF